MAQHQPLQEEDLIRSVAGSSGNNSKRLAIISGVTGMGKQLYTVAILRKNQSSKGREFLGGTLVRVNLADHYKLFQMLNKSANTNILHFLVKLTDVVGQSPFASSLLKYRLETGDRIFLMVDGFDEIDSQC